MTVALVVTVLSVLLLMALVVSSLGDLAKVPSLVATMDRLGVPPALLPVLAAIKLAASVGLVVGFWSAPLQVAMGGALTVYFALAVAMHTRARDSMADTAAAMVLLGAAFALALTALAV